MGLASCNLIFISLVQNQQILIFSHGLSSFIFAKSSAIKTRAAPLAASVQSDRKRNSKKANIE